MDIVERMDRVDGENGLGNVEARPVLGEGVVLDEHGHHVAARNVLHDQVQEVLVLEREVQVDDPRIVVVDRVVVGQQVALGAHVCDLCACVRVR